ncbi:MAG: choice-of-anchor D domain-containing protein [Bryobacteraceae bacterium]|nr:choice-of-anchor D domain-containing protein [Bryobacteraceae bacterium]
MIPRLLPLLLLAAAPVAAQLRLYVVDGQTEQPVPALLDLGEAYVGDRNDLRLRVRNTGPGRATIDRLSVSGRDFSLQSEPTIPHPLAPDASVDFRVRFSPQNYGTSFSAVLTFNTTTVLLVARAAAVPTLLVETGGRRVPASTLDGVPFGEVKTGGTTAVRFHLVNETPITATLSRLEVRGTSFQGPIGLAPPVRLSPNASAAFDVAFTPSSNGAQEGWLLVGDRPVKLTGVGVAPPFPKPIVVLEPATPGNNSAARLSVRFGVASPSAGSGTLELAVRAGAAADDAVQFVSPTSGRRLDFTVAAGDTVAAFGDRREVVFQTGTVAGELVFTAKIGQWSETFVLPLNPAPVEFTEAKAARATGALEVNLTGFDNTRSLTRLAFTFFGRDGAPLPQGAVTVDVTGDFSRYFASSTLGGAFTLRASFPVSGDSSAISAVEVEATNPAGAARSKRLSF